MEINKQLKQEISKLQTILSQQCIDFSINKVKGNDLKYHILYATVNNENDKSYIGIHSTLKEKTSYIGCGINCDISQVDVQNKYFQQSYRRSPFWRAVYKYGKSSFKRIDVLYFYNRESLIAAERLLITKDLVKSCLLYNGTIGGSAPPTNIGSENGNWNNKWTDKQKSALSLKLKGREDRSGSNNSKAKKCIIVDVLTGKEKEYGCSKDVALDLGFSRLSLLTWIRTNDQLSACLRGKRYAMFLKQFYITQTEQDIKSYILNLINNSALKNNDKLKTIYDFNQKYKKGE